MAEFQENLEEMIVYKCPKCNGEGKQINDWNAFNQLGMPVGFSKKAAKVQRQYYGSAYGPCSQCDGKGFLLKPKS
jgi:RecJ-like exonuclease